MRALIVVVSFLVASLLPHSIAVAQERPCDARPRWLVVTVIAGYTLSKSEEPVAWESLGARAVDRCDIYEMFEIDHLDQRLARGSGREFKGPKTTLRLYAASPSHTYELTISESVHDICAAVEDCADATRPAPK